MSVVLVVSQPEGLPIDFGTGVIVAQDDSMSLVLTCLHVVNGTNPMPSIKIRGMDAHPLPSDYLKLRDLVILAVPRLQGSPCIFSSATIAGVTLHCEGFADFIKRERLLLTVDGKLTRIRHAQDDSGVDFHYLEITANLTSDQFAKGMSGGPVFDQHGHVVGITRVRENPSRAAGNVAQAIMMTPEILRGLQDAVPGSATKIAISKSKGHNKPKLFTTLESELTPLGGEFPPLPPPPRQTSIDADDIQKKRWGGKARAFGRRISIANVRHLRYRKQKYFTFDVVLESTDDSSLMGPFFFYLHDSYKPSKIKLSRTRNDGRQVILEEVGAEGTFTIGVQFKDSQNVWRSLEYDLTAFDKGLLKKYD